MNIEKVKHTPVSETNMKMNCVRPWDANFLFSIRSIRIQQLRSSAVPGLDSNAPQFVAAPGTRRQKIHASHLEL